MNPTSSSSLYNSWVILPQNYVPQPTRRKPTLQHTIWIAILCCLFASLVILEMFAEKNVLEAYDV
jgi:hypothetical protein